MMCVCLRWVTGVMKVQAFSVPYLQRFGKRQKNADSGGNTLKRRADVDRVIHIIHRRHFGQRYDAAWYIAEDS